MAIQPINLGTYANDGTGDDLRVAFQKVNANILELYSTVYGANVGSVPPISGVEQGELWWSTVEGRLYIKYGTSWVDASPEDGFVTYDITAETATGGASVRLNGTDLSQDSIKFASSTNVTVTRTDANTITFSSESYTGNVTGNLLGNVQGNVVGNVVGNTNGLHTGAVIGNVTGDVLGDTDGLHTGPVIGDVTGDVTGDTTGTHTGAVIGNVTGNVTGDTTGFHTGNVEGNVTGNVTGAASLNVLTTGDTLTGNINWDTTGLGLTWGMNSDGASIKFYNISDFDSDSRLEFQTRDNGNEYFSWTYATNNGTVAESMRLTPISLNNAALRVFGNVTVDGNVLGNVIGNISGNASTVTNGVYTNGLYADPTWITSLAGSKVSGNISGNAGSVTNGVYTTGDQTIGGIKTFSSTISGNISGNAGTVTNGVYTSSSVNALSDVDTVSVAPTNGQTLVWNSGTSQWKPGTIAAGGVTKIIAGTNISISPTNGLGDVTITSTATGGAGGSLDFGTFNAPAGFSLDLGTF